MDKKVLIGLALTLIIAIFIPAYGINEPARQSAALARQKHEAMDRGAELFTTNCARCHGQAGEGLVGPALRGTQLDEEELQKVISRGTGKVMPAWAAEDGGPLRKHEIRALITFIKNWDSALLESLSAELQVASTPAPTPSATPTPASTPAPTPRAAPSPVATPTPVPEVTPTPAAPDLAAEGRQLFFDLQCIVCHKINGEGGAVGPSLAGLFGSEEDLATGEKVVVDHEYVEESIENPGAKVVKGYPAGVMPKLSLSHEQIDALIDFIKSLAE